MKILFFYLFYLRLYNKLFSVIKAATPLYPGNNFAALYPNSCIIDKELIHSETGISNLYSNVVESFS